MKEVWKNIKEFGSKYQISNLGRVRSYCKNKEKILKPLYDKDGYVCFNLYKNGIMTTRKCHRLVADAFIANEYSKPQVNHIDGNKSNNIVSNLEWATRSENVNHSINVLGNVVKPIMCVETGEIFNSMKDACVKLKLCKANLTMASSDKYTRKTCGGYHWIRV